MTLTHFQIVARLAEVARAYDREWPGKPDAWMPCGVLNLTVSDLREAARRDAETRPIMLPLALDPDLTEILGMPNFQAGPIAHIWRDEGGATIPHKSEVEQAFVIHWLLGLYAVHGSGWRKVAADKLYELGSAAPKVAVSAPPSTSLDTSRKSFGHAEEKP